MLSWIWVWNPVIAWQAPSNNSTHGFNVYRNGDFVGTVNDGHKFVDRERGAAGPSRGAGEEPVDDLIHNLNFNKTYFVRF